MKQKYVLHPGIVSSEGDGKRYFISASTLAHLFGVSLAECRIADISDPVPADDGTSAEIHLYPALEQKEEGASLIVTTASSDVQSLEQVA